MEPPSNNIIVVNSQDGKKYKMVLKGDLGLLTIGKVKRYLHQATGIDPSYIVVRYNNRIVQDGQTGSEIGLFDGAVMYFDVNTQQQQQMSTPTRQPSSASFTQLTQPSPERRAQQDADAERQRQQELERYRRELDTLREQERTKAQSKREEEERIAHEEALRRKLAAREQELERERQMESTRLREERQKIEAEKRALEEERATVRRNEAAVRHQQSEISELRGELEELRREMMANRMTSPRPEQGVFPGHQSQATFNMSSPVSNRRAASPVRNPPPQPTASSNPGVRTYSTADAVRRNLDGLAEELQVPRLELDSNQTCVVTLEDDVTLLVTYDPVTERLYLYSTILANIPEDGAVRLRLYEALLGGALLGREMAGGGIGVSLKNNLILMCTSVDVNNCNEHALRAVAQPFLSSVGKWQAMAYNIVSHREYDTPTHRRSPQRTRPMPQSPPSALNSQHSQPIPPPEPAYHQQPLGSSQHQSVHIDPVAVSGSYAQRFNNQRAQEQRQRELGIGIGSGGHQYHTSPGSSVYHGRPNGYY